MDHRRHTEGRDDSACLHANGHGRRWRHGDAGVPLEVVRIAVRVTLPADAIIEVAEDMAEGWIKDDDTERARKRSLGIMLAGMG